MNSLIIREKCVYVPEHSQLFFTLSLLRSTFSTEEENFFY